jgi:hypothetical protein
MAKKYPSDAVTLESGEENAVFMAINHIDILQIKGMEFYHLFMIILMKDPSGTNTDFEARRALFYNVDSRDLPENEVAYYSRPNWRENTLWETTISASSECAYDTTAKNLGNLTKVPNFDRVANDKTGKRVFVKKIASNDLKLINSILEFESKYDNSLKYSLIPEVSKKGYNSNSYFRGALEFAGLLDQLEIPSCFKSPGLSKSVQLKE